MAANSYPPDCLHSLIAPDPWWEPSDKGVPERGRLLWAFVPMVSITPRTLAPSRAEATEHARATFVLEELRASVKAAPTLPIAALPLNPGEVHTVYRAKRRPVVVLGVGPAIDPRIFGGDKSWQTAPMLIVAPYFGGAAGKRGGWNPEFVRRIRHAEYPNYAYDQLPLGNEPESILRLDQLQPIGNHHNSFERTSWRLSEVALSIIDEQLRWLMTGVLDGDGLLDCARAELPKLEPMARPTQ
jgi:hypothetical protein